MLDTKVKADKTAPLSTDDLGAELSPFSTLMQKIQSKQAVIGVVGLGYVGLPFAVEKARAGFRVIGIDKNSELIEEINHGKSRVPDVKNDDLEKLVKESRLSAVSGMESANEADVIVIAVPTPITRNHTPDLSFVERVSQDLVHHLRPGQLVCLESTTYPGTTAEVVLPRLEASGLVADRDFFLAYSPERVDPGNKSYNTKNTSKVVSGIGPQSSKLAVAFYTKSIDHITTISSPRAAEMVKVFENTFRSVNIALVNEVALLCDKMGLDVWEILDAAFTKPFGIMPFYPGPGVGGHCIPVDPHYLEWKAREYNFATRFISLASEINRMMPEFVCKKAFRLLSQRGIAPFQAKVLAVGAAYKRDISDCRESPAIEVMDGLVQDGASLNYHDPCVPFVKTKHIEMESVELSADQIKEYDLVVILTPHTDVDYQLIVDNAQQILDTRFATRGTESRQNVVLL